VEKLKKRTLSWEMQGQTLHLHSFSFPPSFPDGRGFGSARREKRTKNARKMHGERNMPQADATPYFGEREVAPPVRHQSRWENIQVRRKPGTNVPMTKASGGSPVRQARKEVSKMAKVGCPRKYQSVKQMQKAIDAYFVRCKGEPIIGDDGKPIVDKYGNVILIGQKPPTITGLALALGFTGRQALLDYQARPEFTDTVTRAKSMCEEYAEARLYDRDGANGAKFSLSCNFGWREVNETKISTDAVKVIIDV
jgi:hypothetical protein